MTERLTDLADRLGQVLAEETALLNALDLAAAGGLLARKRDAVAALQAALAGDGGAAALEAQGNGIREDGTQGNGIAGDAARTDTLRRSVQRVAALAEANRSAIERGLALQMRLIEAIARAVPRARATEAPIYQPNGSQSPPRPPEAYAFLSRM
jgi:hypothetical protein